MQEKLRKKLLNNNSDSCADGGLNAIKIYW